MHQFLRLLVSGWALAGLIYGLQAQTVPVVDPAAARAQQELKKAASEKARRQASPDVARAQAESDLKQRALAAADQSRSNTAPGPKVRYATSVRAKATPSANREELERADRLARIEREVERRRVERAGGKPIAPVSVSTAQAVPSTPPSLPTSPSIAAKAPNEAKVVAVKNEAPTTSSLAADRVKLRAEREAQEQRQAFEKARLKPAIKPDQLAAVSPEEERKAREMLRQTLQDLQKEEAASKNRPASKAPSKVGANPVPDKSALRQEEKARKETAQRAKAEAKAREKVLTEQARVRDQQAKPAAEQKATPSAVSPVSPEASQAVVKKEELRKAEASLKAEEQQKAHLAAQEKERARAEAAARLQLERQKAEQARIKAEAEVNAAKEARAKAEAEARREKEIAVKAQRDAEAKQALEVKAKRDAEAKQALDAKVKRDQKAKAAEAKSKAAKVAAIVSPEPNAKKAAATPKSAKMDKPAKKTAQVVSKGTPEEAVAAPTTKMGKLQELLKAYTRNENPISAGEYHRERARILAQPGE